MAEQPRLSVALIARNEAHQLRDCLASVAWADEVVVVEQGSMDDTAAVARALGAKVLTVDDWPGFGPQKNRAIDACTGDWILALDCDERVDDALRTEIQGILAAPRYAVYRVGRRSTYCGQFIEHSGWRPDYVTRLFKRGAARYSEAAVHETLITNQAVGTLKQTLTHYSFTRLEDVLDKMNRYSSASAAMLVARGKTPGLMTAVLHGLAAFVRTYFFRLGFLDGRMGFLLAVSNAEGSYYRYVKAWLAVNGQKRAH